MILIPYWWDRKVESLQATIYQKYPYLLIESGPGKPIPKTPTEFSLESSAKSDTLFHFEPVEGLHTLSTPKWNNTIDPTNWYNAIKFAY